MMLKMVKDYLWLSRTWGHVRCFQPPFHTILMEGIYLKCSESKEPLCSSIVVSHQQYLQNLFLLFSDLGDRIDPVASTHYIRLVNRGFSNLSIAFFLENCISKVKPQSDWLPTV